MLFAVNLTGVFFYTLPNLLNSILVCIFMNYAAQEKEINAKDMGKKTFMVIIPLLYFAVFSVFYSVAIIAAYCFFTLVFKFLNKKVVQNITLIIVLVGALVYVIMEYNSIRIKTGFKVGQFYEVSLFGIAFLQQCRVALKNFYGLFNQIHKGLLAVTIGINILALVLLIINRKRDIQIPLVKSGIVSLLCLIGIIPIFIIVAAKGTPSHFSDIMYIHGIFFYYFLMSGLTLLYIITCVKKVAFALSFMLILLFIQTTNSNNPYKDQNSYYYNELTTQEKREYINSLIEQVKFADDHGMASVVTESPHSNDYYWPFDPDYGPQRITESLFRHGITSKRISIFFTYDNFEEYNSNRVVNATFDDGFKGNWRGDLFDIVDVQGKPFKKVLATMGRNVFASYFSVSPGERWQVSATLNSESCNANFFFGVHFQTRDQNGVVYDNYTPVISLDPGQSWTDLSGVWETPENAFRARPILVIESWDDFGIGLGTNFVIEPQGSINDIILPETENKTN